MQALIETSQFHQSFQKATEHHHLQQTIVKSKKETSITNNETKAVITRQLKEKRN